MKPAFDILKAVLFLFLCSCRPAPESRQKAPANPDLEACFVDPPAAFRPWAYWVWINGNVSQAELSRDLEEIKAKGMGGFDIFDCGERFPDQGEVPAGPAFLGSESVKAIGHAIREADRLGLGLGLITSSSWNAGGSWIKPEHANMALFPSERVLVKGPSRFDEKLPFPSFPEKTPKREDGKPLFYKEIAVVAYPNATDSVIRDISLVKDISGQVDQDGRLRWDVPDGEWNIVRFICTNTGKMLHSPSINSNGLVIDHFNPDATQVHFQSIVDSLMKGGITLGDNALKYLYLCSYEVWGISWTPNFQNEFSARRGYSIIPYLPALTGQTIGNEEVTSRFRYDFDKTICDLIVDAHYKNATRISNQYGLQLSAESGGPGPVPVEALKALGALDIPRGEFWYGSNTSLVKEIACAAHIYGKELVEQEAYTSWVMWQEGPCDLKAISDNSFCNGMNKIIFHTYPHHPDGNDSPGWAYYAGTHIGPGRVWWPKAKPFMDYLSRCSFLLRQGLFVGDVCYYYGDQGFNYVPEKNTDPSLGYGYDYDVTNPEVILTRMDAVDGKIVLPDGMSYELLALPSRKDMDLEVLRKIQKLVRAGVTIAGPKPSQSNGLNRYPEKDEEVRKLADELWGDCDGETVTENQYGKGKVIWGRPLSEILRDRGVGRDFSFMGGNGETDLDYIHRRTAGEDIYFVRNKKNTVEQVTATFRVKDKIPELWFPETGAMTRCAVYEQTEGGTALALTFGPEEAFFVVFREGQPGNRIVSVSREGTTLFPHGNGDPFQIVPDSGHFNLIAWKAGFYEVKTADGQTKDILIENDPVEFEVGGYWEIRFPEGRGAPASAVLPSPASWTENPDEGIRYFSGIATYYKEFELPSDFRVEGRQLVLDLGRVRVLADVRLNGSPVGILWKSPFQADITPALKPGKNELIVEVANTWSNRLTGDARLPEGKRITKTNIKHVGGPLKKGYLWQDAPLPESGLLGPVRILSVDQATFALE